MMRNTRYPKNENDEVELLIPERNTEDVESHSYDSALLSCGYGKFHYWLCWVCGWANASDAVEIIAISFLLPSAECDLQLSPNRKGWLSAILFVGMMIGGYVWGALGDSLGRRTVLINAMLVNGIAGLVSSFSQDFYMFLILRFVSGVGVGGSIPVVWSYFAEFQPSGRRGAALSVLASFWMVGNVVVAGMAWAVIPHELGWTDPQAFQFNSWRIFVVLSALPSLLVSLALLSLPESPKFLLARGRMDECLAVLANIHKANTGKAVYPVQRLSERTEPSIKHSKKSWLETLRDAKEATMSLFSPSLFKVTVTMIIINFAIQFGYYGLWLWFPELFNKLEHYYELHPGESKTVCQVISMDNVLLNSTSEFVCTTSVPDDSVFINSFLISLSALPTNLWTIVHMDKLGRKFFLCLSMLLSGGSVFLIYIVDSAGMNLALSCIFGAVSTAGFNALDCLGIELFPTSVRSTAMAVTLLSARLGAVLGNLSFGYLIEYNCAVPILLVAGLLTGGGLLGITLPNTTKQPLE